MRNADTITVSCSTTVMTLHTRLRVMGGKQLRRKSPEMGRSPPIPAAEMSTSMRISPARSVNAMAPSGKTEHNQKIHKYTDGFDRLYSSFQKIARMDMTAMAEVE